MVIKQLAYLDALVRERHFARAAAACHVTQPTLSAAIRQLESELGVPIVLRGQRYQGLTPEGQLVLSAAQEILGHCEALKQRLESRRSGLSGQLRLGAVPTALPLLARLTAPFAENHQAVALSIRKGQARGLLEEMRRFRIDAALMASDVVPQEGFRSLPLYRERYVLLTPGDGPFAEAPVVTLDQVARTPLCLMQGCLERGEALQRAVEASGLSLQAGIETESMVDLCAHVASGSWSSLVPQALLYVFGPPPGTRAVALAGSGIVTDLSLVVLARDPLPPILEVLLRASQQLQAQLQAEIDHYIAPFLRPPLPNRAA